MQLNYRIIEAQGPTVLFIHGFLENTTMWDGFLSVFSKFRLVLVDLPGHGASPDAGSSNYSLAEVAQSILHAEALNGHALHAVVGHSLGGYVALALAKLAIEKAKQINNVVLLNSHPWADSDAKKEDRNRVARLVAQDKDSFLRQAIPGLFLKAANLNPIIEQYIGDAQKMSSDAIVAATYAMRDRPDQTALMKLLGNKLTVIQGEQDHLIPAAEMEQFCKTNGNNYYLIRNAGHMCHEEKKQETITVFNQVLLA